MNKETCFFYSKTNGCRHGLECNKRHPNASRGRVVVIKNMYLYPPNDVASALDATSVQIHVDLFYEDWFTELSLEYGRIKKIAIASNSCTQLLGNVYIEFENEVGATKCIDSVRKRCYGGKRILAEVGNCHRIEECICNDNERGSCTKGEQCSFVHVARVSRSLVNELSVSQELFYRMGRNEQDAEGCRRGQYPCDPRNLREDRHVRGSQEPRSRTSYERYYDPSKRRLSTCNSGKRTKYDTTKHA